MRRIILLIEVLLLALGGCASMPETTLARRIEASEKPVLKPDEIVVVGRILFIENGQNKAPYTWGKPLWQIERQAGDGKTGQRLNIPFLSTRRSGDFAYAIPAGQYQISHVEPFYYLPFIEPALEFIAAEPGQIYYLGDLVIDFDASTWLGGLLGNYITHLNHVEVLDRYNEHGGHFAALLVGTEPVRKALLTRIHGRIPELRSTGGAGLLVIPHGSIKFGR